MGIFRNFARRFWSGTYPQSAADALFLAPQPSSGEIVNENNAMRLVPIYRAITLISNDLARMPVSVYRRTSSGEESRPNAIADLVDRDPNRYMSGFEFRRTLTSQVLRWGNAFAQIVRSQRGEILELVPLQPESVTMFVEPDGSIYYKQTELGRMEPEEILHLKAPGYDGMWGESPIRMAAESLGLMKAQERTGGATYKNAATPKLAFIHPKVLSPDAQEHISQAFHDRHSGADNAGKPLILQEGMTVEKVQMSLEQVEWLQARTYSVQDVSRLFGVPAPYLADLSRSTLDNVQTMVRSYIDTCLTHWISVWCETIRRSLLAPGDYMKFDTSDLLRGSFKDQVESLRVAVESGVLTRNEARARLNYNELPGLSDPILPLNMSDLEAQIEAEDQVIEDEDTNDET